MPDRRDGGGQGPAGHDGAGRRILHAVRAGAPWLGWGLAAGLAARLWSGTKAGAAPVRKQPDDGQPPAADAQQQENMPPARRERTDVGLRAMAVAGALLLAGLGSVLGLASWLYPGSRTDKAFVPPNGSEFPAPRLQTDVGADMARFRAEQLQQLDGAYWLDRDRGVVHMPIQDAMRDVAGRGIPDWPAAPAWVRR